MIQTILSYAWQYITNPKLVIALSILVALVSSYSVVPRQYFFMMVAAYILGLVIYGIYWLIQRRKHAEQGEALAEAIQQDTTAEYGKQKDKEELEFENAKKYTTLHPRCGTSFLFIVMMVSILIYSTLDVIIPKPDTHLMRILLKVGIRFGFMPIVAGLSYEIQKYSSRHMDNPLVSLLALPGLKLQNITTQEPDESQLEVGMTALRASLNMEVNAINIEEEQK